MGTDAEMANGINLGRAHVSDRDLTSFMPISHFTMLSFLGVNLQIAKLS
jgi:hypothetical protein